MITGQGENGAISILAKQFQGYTTLLSLSDPNDDDDDQIGEEKAGRLHRDGGMRPANPSVLHHIPFPKNIPPPISQKQSSTKFFAMISVNGILVREGVKKTTLFRT